jgi:hypothetical protein
MPVLMWEASSGVAAAQGEAGETPPGDDDEAPDGERRYVASGTLPPFASWVHQPVILQPSAGTMVPAGQPPDGFEQVPIGIPFNFESDLFHGKALLRFRGLETSTDKEADARYFAGNSHSSQIVIQGRFKQPTPVADVLVGGKFGLPLKVKPPPFIHNIIRGVLRQLTPDVQMDLLSDTPKVLASFAASVQTLRADEAGSEPDILSASNIEENNAAFGGSFEGGVSGKARKELFRDPARVGQFVFDKETVYTFESYDDVLDYGNYELNVRVYRFDLTMVLQEPFPIMAVNQDGDYLWLFRIWHERLLD